MRIFLDIDTRRLLAAAARPLARVELKRRDTDLLELQFLRDGAPVDLPEGTTVRLGIKPANDYAGDFLALSVFVKSSPATYNGDLDLHTQALATAFTDEPKSIAAMLEVEWTSGTNVSSSLTVPVTIHNDVLRGDEGEPATLPLFYTAQTSDFLATQAQAEDGQDNATWMSPLRTAQAIAALAASDWESVSDKPSTFPPSAHTHEIADTTGLQAALDGKQVAGSYAPATHTHSLSDLSESGAGFGQVPVWDGSAWTPADPSGGVSSWNDLTDKPSTFPPSSHTHAASDITSGTLGIARIPTGTTSTTVCIGNDSRLSDARTPTTHVHGNISNVGAIGTDSGVPIITGTSGVLQAGAFGTTAGTFAAGNHTHSGMLTGTGGITTIAVVATMPASPDATTLYIVTA
jgi:hypothetical protein